MLTFIIITLCLASVGAGLLALPSLLAIGQGAWANRPSFAPVEGMCLALMGHDDEAERTWPALYWAAERLEARLASWRATPSREAQRAATEITKRDAIIGIQDMAIGRLQVEVAAQELAGKQAVSNWFAAMGREAELRRDMAGTLRTLESETALRESLEEAAGEQQRLFARAVDHNARVRNELTATTQERDVLRLRLTQANEAADSLARDLHKVGEALEASMLATKQARTRNRYLRGQLNQLGPYIMPPKGVKKSVPAALPTVYATC